MKILAFITALLCASPAAATVMQSGNVTPGHVVMWTTTGVVQDGGTAAIPFLTSMGVVASGPGICQNSAAITGPYNQLCFAPTSTGGGFTWTAYNGATGVPSFTINGTVYPFPFSNSGCVGPATTTLNDIVIWGNTAGTLCADSGLKISAATQNELLYFSSTSQISGAASVNNGVLSTNGSGLPSVSATLPSGLTIPAPTVSGAASFTGTDNFSGTFQIGGAAQTFPASGILAGTTDTQTLTNKTLTAPTINGGALSGTFSGTPTLSGANFVTLANIVQAGAFTLDGNPTGSAANRSDFTIGSLTAKAAPTSSDLVIIADEAASGALKQATVGEIVGSNTMVLLNTLTASNSASLSDTTSLTSTYSSYKIVISDLIPATSSNLELLVQVGGSFVVTGYVGGSGGFTSSGSTSFSNTTTYISLAGGTLNNAAPGYGADLIILNPSAAAITQIGGSFIASSGSSSDVYGTVGGYYNTSGAVTGIKFQAVTGNLTSGTIKIYGIP